MVAMPLDHGEEDSEPDALFIISRINILKSLILQLQRRDDCYSRQPSETCFNADDLKKKGVICPK